MWSRHKGRIAGVEVPGLASIQTLLHDSEALLKATAQEGNERVQDIRSRVEKSLREARHTYDAAQSRGLRKARRFVRETDTYAHDHPWPLVAAGLGLGLIIGLLAIGSRDK